MATTQIGDVLRTLRGTLLLRDEAGLSDGQLLRDYLDHQDEAALATLVCRHGPMVWGVCRRVLRNHHDAEDAVQATFLVLVRRASSIASPDQVANWLHGVAFQTAIKARATAAKRIGRERQMPDQIEPAAPEERGHDLLPLLDQELKSLAARYRTVLVLCDLEGKTRKEAAQELGCPEGTVAGRLARAREMLAKRLSRHGVPVTAAVLAAALTHEASASVPTSVLVSTINVMNPSAAVPAQVAALTEGVLKTMFLNKLKLAVVMLLSAGVVGTVAIVLVGNLLASGQPGGLNPDRPHARDGKEAEPAAKATITLGDPVSRMRWSQDGKVMVGYGYREQQKDGKKVSLFTFRVWNGQTGKLLHDLGEAEFPGYGMYDVSADGKQLVIGQQGPDGVGGQVQVWDIVKGTHLQTIALDKQPSQVKFAISPDSGTVAVAGSEKKDDKTRGVVWLFDTKTGKLARKIVRDAMEEALAVAFSSDGKLLAAGGSKGEVVVWELAADKEVMTGLAPDRVEALAFSPDNQSLIAPRREQTKPNPGAQPAINLLLPAPERDGGVLLWDLKAGKSRELKGHAGGNELSFSPDGRYVAAVGVIVKGRGSEEWGLRVWDVQSGKQIHAWPGIGWRGFAFDPDGKRLTVVADQNDKIETKEVGRPSENR